MVDIQQKIMGALKPAFVSDIKKKMKSGELVSPVKLDDIVSSVDDAIKLNPITWAATGMLGIEPRDYRDMLKEALIECGLEVIEEKAEISTAPTIYCPRDKSEVPIWHCLGSLTQNREKCSYLVQATVHGAERAEVKCKWK